MNSLLLIVITSEHMKVHIFELQRIMRILLIIAVMNRHSGLNGIRTHDFSDTGAVLSLPTELSSQLEADFNFTTAQVVCITVIN